MTNMDTLVCCTLFSQQQDESARRHKENIDQIKEKAFEMTVLKHSTEDQKDAPKLAPYSTKKFCTVCNVLVRNSAALTFQLSPKQLCCRKNGFFNKTSPLTDGKHQGVSVWLSQSCCLNGPLHAIYYRMLLKKYKQNLTLNII